MQQLAHDLASPLTPVKLQLRLLEGQTNEEGKHGLAIVKRNIDHVQRLVADLGDVVRLESGQLRIERKPTNLAELCRNTVDSLAPSATERGLGLDAETPTTLMVSVDAGRMTQVLYNLVSNALKFTPPGGRVHVTAGVADVASVSVQDSGAGLRPDQLENLFKAFSQVHDPAAMKRPEDRGSGLGLFISKGIVESHGGTMDAASPGPGMGSTFTFHLPLLA
ncbi:MAG: sensor histidine kinase [Thermoplasmatota archaeon]